MTTIKLLWLDLIKGFFVFFFKKESYLLTSMTKSNLMSPYFTYHIFYTTKAFDLGWVLTLEWKELIP